ncbi:MAG TPA: hypothetical protein VK576_00345 [Thermoleophilia bacterium]|nr:hypothetical protein [Thermoleophilia bacterium]
MDEARGDVAAPRCPYCGESMIAGMGEMGGTLTGFLLFGFSREHFWFVSKERGVRRKIVTSDTPTLAHLCPSCGAVAVPRRKGLLERAASAAGAALTPPSSS